MKINAFFYAAVLLSAFSHQAQAVVLNTDGQWHTFDVDNAISASGNLEWIELDGNALSFDFTLTEAAYLNIVDGGFAGDRFEVFDNGNSIGLTSFAVNSYPNSAGLDFDQAFANSDFSRGQFLLGAGNHSITGFLNLSALDADNIEINATVGAVNLTAVPLPAAAWLYTTGAALLGFATRRRHTNVWS